VGVHANPDTARVRLHDDDARRDAAAAAQHTRVHHRYRLLSGRPSSVMSCHLQKSDPCSKSLPPTRLPTMCTSAMPCAPHNRDGPDGPLARLDG